MALALDFTAGKVFARGIYCGKVTVEGAQSRLGGDFVKNNDPAAIHWPDDGGQFKTVLGQLFQGIMYCARTLIPPGNQVINGYVEVLRRILTAMHGGVTPLRARGAGV